jgi:hypothetical protein
MYYINIGHEKAANPSRERSGAFFPESRYSHESSSLFGSSREVFFTEVLHQTQSQAV